MRFDSALLRIGWQRATASPDSDLFCRRPHAGVILQGVVMLATMLTMLTPVALLQTGAVVTFEPVAGALDRVTGITSTAAVPQTVWISEQVGRLRLVENGTLRPLPFLDITSRVKSTGFEQGLTGFALAPGFPAVPEFYVHYIRADDASVIARFALLPGPVLAGDAASEQILMVVPQPHPTHNCNQLHFGPADGMLYIGCGDGGPPFTPFYDPQSLSDLHGKILRIDVTNVPPGHIYGIPPDNPFVGLPGAAGEVWAVGLRNPYRFSFDSANNDLWISDVGQSHWEEVNHVSAVAPAGVNFGWNRMEGAHCYPPGSTCSTAGLHVPAISYYHGVGCAVIGGVRLRQSQLPAIEARYTYADFCTGDVFAAYPAGGAWETYRLGVFPQMPTAFGMTPEGELWIGSYGVGDATVYRVRQIDSIFVDGLGG
ncbi:PQQ-dependent sugar dehydrogenase [Tahibacter amnicola]|uniref:PQQ-dependent sugar dehydrogenase n=1 Tax=Tahibacter amnicola TaxID=2976241 RepID=A0ABY6BGN0_9GAMM|nr:PQQ-dependent sugar dehydrogenase [Tahibacter amnicola]UXI68919.1 PQQ-dependent sugar dehydrogenase [Tahibacter amnicola]